MDESERIKNMCEFSGRVYSVGDGFCYEGRLKNKSDNRYHFVIDCGTRKVKPTCGEESECKLSNESPCKNRLLEITDEIAEHNKNIDVFILTHLHEDHYNGYKYLFDKTKIDTIIMPYLYPVERLCLMLNRDDLSVDEAEFLAAPYRKLMEFAREKNPNVKLVLFRGTASEDNLNQDGIDSSDDIIWGEPHEDTENILELENLNIFVKLENSNALGVQIVRAFQNRIRIPNFNWYLKFFNLEADKTKIAKLKKFVGELSANTLSKINEIIEESKKNNDNAMIKKILKEEYRKMENSFFDEIRQKTEELFGQINNTSIVIYHGPDKILEDQFCRIEYSISKEISKVKKNLSENENNTSIVIDDPIIPYKKNGTLITGDISFKAIKDADKKVTKKNNTVANKILNHFSSEINNVGLFSIPHHGSNRNWDYSFIKDGNLNKSACFASTHKCHNNRVTKEMRIDLGCHNINVFVVDDNRYNEIEQEINICNMGNIDSSEHKRKKAMASYCRICKKNCFLKFRFS